MSEYKKKLIEVALPLEEINAACKADKDRKIGTIRNIHKWFAPMPLPAWRALIYAALIDDPGNDEQRAYHLDVIKRLVRNGADLPDESGVREAMRNLDIQFPEGTPPILDPFCGGGSTLVEARRLGLETLGSDLNPVPVLITRTLTDVVPRVYGQAPLHPDVVDWRAKGKRRRQESRQDGLYDGQATHVNWSGYEGLAQDVLYYGQLVREESGLECRRHFPQGEGETPIAWVWARTADCPNPACGFETVLITSWWLSKKTNDLAWIEPSVVGGKISLRVVSQQRSGEAPTSPKIGDGVFSCVSCNATLDGPYLRGQGKAGKLGLIMTAVIVKKGGQRLFRSVTVEDTDALDNLGVVDTSSLNVPINSSGQGIRVGLYGFETWDAIYTPRQALVLGSIADRIAKIPEKIRADGGSEEWGRAVATLLALALGKAAQYNSSQTRLVLYEGSSTRFNCAFGRNDLPMIWDFYEPNIFGDDGPNWMQMIETSLSGLPFVPVTGSGRAVREDARRIRSSSKGLVATDPPYFDAIGYADLSDYFYLWHRRALRSVYPDLYSTAATPKKNELTAIPGHHGNIREAAREYFISGFTETFKNLQKSLAPGLPLLVVYASKEQKGGRDEEGRWSSILTAMVNAGLELTGTWPIHGTGKNRLVGQGTNALASYVVMASRPRASNAGTCSLQDFNRDLRRELRLAVHALQGAGILPVDLAQAAMGPGMQVYSRYRAVQDQSGAPVPVEAALRLINLALGEVLDEQEGELDPDSRFAVTWWEKHHWGDATFGEADQLARPYGISVDDVIRAGVAVNPRPGFVRVIGDSDLDRNWTPSMDGRPTAWEAVHHLVDRLIDGGGVSDGGELMSQLGGLREQAQSLVYRLHAIADRKGWTKDQERYNALIGSWSDLLAEAGRQHEGESLF